MVSVFAALLDACSSVQRAGVARIGSSHHLEEDIASEIQLNAFEFRNHRSSLEAGQHKLVERVVNQWCFMLVKGKTLKVNDFEEKVKMDKDLLVLEYGQEEFPLKAISKIEMFKDAEAGNIEDEDSFGWGLNVSFEGTMGETVLRFSFDQENQRLGFALTLRVLRTRDPMLDPSQSVQIIPDEPDEDAKPTFGKIVSTQHYNIDKGIPIVFSVSDLKLFQKLQSTSRHVYLEFFVRYPRQERFLYAKSPTTHIPQQVLVAEDAGLRRKKEKRDEADEEEEKREEAKRLAFKGHDIPICQMKFDLKNVKLKVPQIPHTIFGRLMAKDDYFPTAISTFAFEVEKAMIQDRRSDLKSGKKRSSVTAAFSATEPVRKEIDMMSSWKMASKDANQEEVARIGMLTIRILGYVFDQVPDNNRARARERATAAAQEEDNQDEEEESDNEGEDDADSHES